MVRDAQGNALTGATTEAAWLYDQAVHELQCYINDPVATVDAAIAASPEFVMAHVLRAQLHLLGTEAAGLPAARDSLETAAALPADERERTHLAAIRDFVTGDFFGGREKLEDILIAHPRDALALQAAHLWDFYLGDSRNLRDRIARVIYAWNTSVPGYHAVLGMYAFGLEECGDYARAEALGREAVALNDRDGWAQHAVAHVLEMQGRTAEGIAWMRGNVAGWATDSFFAVHNWWHLALYHLDRGEIDQVLALYDGPIRGKRSTVILDLIDASALLWRLYLRGIDVGTRWNELAEAWSPMATDAFYVFNDCHALMAFLGAGRRDLVETVFDAMVRRVGKGGTNDAMTRDVGLPVARALHAFDRGDYRQTITLLRPVRATDYRFGGSHAQRDLLDLTLVEAALRSGDHALARALASERIEAKPMSPVARLFAARAGMIAADDRAPVAAGLAR